MQLRSDSIKKGLARAPHRSLLKADGLTDEELDRPLVAVISAQNEVIPGHIHLQQIADAAVENGRKVVVTGRSMIQNTDIARRLGYLNIQDVDLIDAYDLKQMPPEKVVIMCTGSQG